MQAVSSIEEPILVRFDPMGQITLPRYLRKQLGIGAEEEVNIYMENGAICIERLSKR